MKKTLATISFWICTLLALSGPASAANLLANSGFEPTPPVSTAWDAYKSYGNINAPSWNYFGAMLNSDSQHQPNGPLPVTLYKNDPVNSTVNPVPDYAPNGIPKNIQYFYDLGGYGTPDPEPGDYVSQDFVTVPGHKYKLTFGHNSEANGLKNSEINPGVLEESGLDSIRVQVGDQDVVFNSPYQSGSPNYGLQTVGVGELGAWQMPWVPRVVEFTATATTTTVKFLVATISNNLYGGDPIRNGANSQLIALPEVVELPPTLTVNKALGGAGRLNTTTDQFTVFIKLGGTVVNNVTHSTTQGSGTGITGGSGTTDVFTAVAATDYVVGEDPASGSTTALGQYSSSMACVNSSAAADKTTFLASLPVPSTLRLKDSDVVTCTITNAPGTPRLTIIKTSRGATGEFHFKGTTANHNGFTTDSSYVVTTAVAGTALPGATVTLAAANTLTEIQEIVPAGWTLNSATCVDANAASDGNTPGIFGSVTGATLAIPAINLVSGSDIRCTFTNTSTGFTLSGKVLTDTGVGSGAAHDAIQNGSELGHAGVLLSLTNCSGTVYSTTTSAGDGSFSLSLNGTTVGQAVCLVESLPGAFSPVSVHGGNTAGSYTATTTTTTLQFTTAADTHYSGVVLGDAPLSTFTGDGAQQTMAGQSVAYAHIYVAGSAGIVTFSSQDSPTPSGLLWSSVLYRDDACDGLLNAPDAVITSPISVVAGEQICILDRVNTPAGANNGVSDATTVRASEVWSVPTLTPVSQTHILFNTDITTVSSAGLTLHKEVRVLSACPGDAAASIANATPYASSGRASPGAFLEYRLRYSNNTSAPLTSVKVFDTVPVYTLFVRGQCLTLPATGVATCATQQPAAGASSGPISWTLTDAATSPAGLQPSATGTVSYCLQVQPP